MGIEQANRMESLPGQLGQMNDKVSYDPQLENNTSGSPPEGVLTRN